jgi:hypothetical protein
VSFVKTIWLLFGCVTCGFYGTPVLMRWWGLDTDYAGAVGAVLGFVGLSFAEGGLRAADNWSTKLFEKWLDKAIPRTIPPEEPKP